MELLKTDVTDNGTRIKTYFNDKITSYGEQIEQQRSIALLGGYADSQEHYRIGFKEVSLVKGILDTRTQGFDSVELNKEILLSGNHNEYLAQWFKGRGSHQSHHVAVLLMLEQIAPEVAKLTGYELERFGQAWELRKEK